MFQSFKNAFKSFRKDGWQNTATNLGVSSSRTSSTLYKSAVNLDQYTLEALYKSNGIAKRVVNIVVDDAIRGFIEADNALLDKLKRVKAKQQITKAGRFGRLYGGALLVALVDDGLPLEMPLNLRRVHSLISLKVFDRHQVRWTNDDLCTDFFKEYYGEPEVYTIQSTSSQIIDDQAFRVHRSRCFLFGGEDLVNSEKAYNQGWDVSVLQSCYEALRNYGLVVNSSAEIVQDFIQVLMKMDDLTDKLSAPNGTQEIHGRMQAIDLSRSASNLILLDSESEDYEKRASSVGGLSDLWDRFAEGISSATGIPATRLFGRSPAGMNATGKSDMQNWYDIVSAYRENQIEPCMTWLIEILQAQKNWKKKPESLEWEFPSLTEPSESEWADIKKKYAEIDALYIDRGAIDPIEVWQERFGSGVFQSNIQVSKPEIENVIEVEEENKDLLSKNTHEEALVDG